MVTARRSSGAARVRLPTVDRGGRLRGASSNAVFITISKNPRVLGYQMTGNMSATSVVTRLQMWYIVVSVQVDSYQGLSLRPDRAAGE